MICASLSAPHTVACGRRICCTPWISMSGQVQRACRRGPDCVAPAPRYGEINTFIPLYITMHRSLLLFVGGALLLLSTQASAAWLLNRVSESTVPGEPVELELIVLNDTTEPIEGNVPPRIPAVLTTRDGAVDVELTVVDAKSAPEAQLWPGQFRKHLLRRLLPTGVHGTIALTVAPAVRLVMVTAPPTTVAAAPEARSAPAEVRVQEPDPVLRATDTTPPPALQTHEPMYFLVGRREGMTSARFQLSFKYRFFDERNPLRRIAPVDKLYFGYTQTSIWDLSEDSSPFRDTVYRPSLFYFDPDVWSSTDGSHTIGLSAGLEHASNGRGGDDSRSINIAFVEPSWRKFLSDSKWYVSVSPKLWAYLDKEDNPDIADYYGYGALSLKLGRVDGWLFGARWRKGTDTMG